MKFKFEWNEFADQPHNVAPRSERTRHHLRHWRTYFSMLGADIRDGFSGLLSHTGAIKKECSGGRCSSLADMFAVSSSPSAGRHEDICRPLERSGSPPNARPPPVLGERQLDSSSASFSGFSTPTGSARHHRPSSAARGRFRNAGWAARSWRTSSPVFRDGLPVLRDRPRLEPDEMGRLGLHRIPEAGPARLRPSPRNTASGSSGRP